MRYTSKGKTFIANTPRSYTDTTESGSRLRNAKAMALKACKDFMGYNVPGYDANLIKAINDAKSEAEIRSLLRKARAMS